MLLVLFPKSGLLWFVAWKLPQRHHISEVAYNSGVYETTAWNSCPAKRYIKIAGSENPTVDLSSSPSISQVMQPFKILIATTALVVGAAANPVPEARALGSRDADALTEAECLPQCETNVSGLYISCRCDEASSTEIPTDTFQNGLSVAYTVTDVLTVWTCLVQVAVSYLSHNGPRSYSIMLHPVLRKPIFTKYTSLVQFVSWSVTVKPRDHLNSDNFAIRNSNLIRLVDCAVLGRTIHNNDNSLQCYVLDIEASQNSQYCLNWYKTAILQLVICSFKMGGIFKTVSDTNAYIHPDSECILDTSVPYRPWFVPSSKVGNLMPKQFVASNDYSHPSTMFRHLASIAIPRTRPNTGSKPDCYMDEGGIMESSLRKDFMRFPWEELTKINLKVLNS
ncbi:hypothetical protein C8R45DRAFT_941737 [Mycena sanguinolenta]|nr:hypothetical protein C8R45DRAFT_941737 [Mycena sanguinolenta]